MTSYSLLDGIGPLLFVCLVNIENVLVFIATQSIERITALKYHAKG
jgi:sorbitol-specific phosphotransferase system component IIC